jgi:hypothetical protein
MSNLNNDSQLKTPYEQYLDARDLAPVSIGVALKASVELLRSGSKAKPFLLGGAGVGKTEGVNTYVSDALDAFCVALVGGFCTVEQERGIPVIEENTDGSVTFNPAARDVLSKPLAELRSTGKIARDGRTYSAMLIFFDELNQADSDVLKIFFSAFTSNTLPGLDWNGLPVYIMAAGNPPVNGYHVKKIHQSEAWDRRLCTIAIKSTTYREWSRWAKTNNVDGNVLSYLKQKPELLDKERGKEQKVPTPATWAAVSDFLKSGIDITKPYAAVALEGMLGRTTGIDFRQYVLAGSEDTLSGEEMLKNKFSEVEEYIETTIKDGKLAQLSSGVRGLAEHVVSLGMGDTGGKLNVSDLSTRIVQILDLLPADTVSVYSRSLGDAQQDISAKKTSEQVADFLREIGAAALTGPMSKEWNKLLARNNASLRDR